MSFKQNNSKRYFGKLWHNCNRLHYFKNDNPDLVEPRSQPMQNNEPYLFHKSSKQLERWVKEAALPLWAAIGIRDDTGGHIEQVTTDGKPDLSTTARMRVTSRQIFVFSYAFQAGWLTNGQQLANRLWCFSKSCRRNVHYPQLLSAQHTPLDTREDLYDYAFHILANTWFYKAFDDTEKLHHACALADYIDSQYYSAKGGWLEGNYEYKYRRQNPHMHLFEAFLLLYEITGEAIWMIRSTRIFTLFESTFINHKHQTLLEYFNDDWGLPSDESALVAEPGHLYEWVWLLTRYQSLSGHDIASLISRVYLSAESFTLNDTGLISDTVNVSTGKHSPTKRCWPLTEAIKAHISMYQLGDVTALTKAKNAIDTLMNYYFIGAKPGMYVDQLGQDNQVISNNMPASTMYHIIVAAHEASMLRAKLFKCDTSTTSRVSLC